VIFLSRHGKVEHIVYVGWTHSTRYSWYESGWLGKWIWQGEWGVWRMMQRRSSISLSLKKISTRDTWVVKWPTWRIEDGVHVMMPFEEHYRLVRW